MTMAHVLPRLLRTQCLACASRTIGASTRSTPIRGIAGRQTTTQQRLQARNFSTTWTTRKDVSSDGTEKTLDWKEEATDQDEVTIEETTLKTEEVKIPGLVGQTEEDRLVEQRELEELEELYEVLDDTEPSGPLKDADPQLEGGTESANKQLEQTATYVPWYLQQHPPRPSALPRDPLPELPASPPPILEPVINHLDEALGIRRITLLDLRPISETVPLPLGRELIMLFGTCRSERHLHMSADKLCRFIRSNFGDEYGLQPHADGLMGRNELKLRERRRRRRGKPSTAAVGEVLEETRIEWVCCTLGQGVVVQLFTDAKREDLDLEGLWQSTLRKEMKRLEKLEAEMAEKAMAESGPGEAKIVDETEAEMAEKEMAESGSAEAKIVDEIESDGARDVQAGTTATDSDIGSDPRRDV